MLEYNVTSRIYTERKKKLLLCLSAVAVLLKKLNMSNDLHTCIYSGERLCVR